MFRFLCKTLLYSRNGYSFVKPDDPSMVASSSLIRYFSSDAHNSNSFTVSYLTKTCGLSPQSALSACKSVQFESSEQPDSVIFCFQKFGFSESNISRMITKFPKLLKIHPKTISPKVEFFRSKGLSTPEIVNIFTVNPRILRLSLENHLVHAFNVLVKMFQLEHKAIEVIKHNPYALHVSPKAGLIPNVNSLRENGVPDSNILWLICNHWLCIGGNPTKFEKIVEEVKEMGFNSLKLLFLEAIMVLTLVTKSKWDARVEVYKSYGWSDKDIKKAFKKHPKCMIISEDRILDMMDFYVKKLGLESSVIVNCPALLKYSLKKRLIPRGAVIKYLSSKGLLKLGSKISSMFICTERVFLEKYAKAPHLKKLYKEKLELSDAVVGFANVEK